MSTDEIVVRVEGVYKDFKLPHEKTNSLKSLITSAYKKRDKGYETQHALKDISFEIKKGEFFGIVGRNGSGKSTLLKIIAEIYRPTKGKVTKHGKLVPFIELGVGFNPELTGRENVFLNGALLGFTHDEMEAMYDDIVEFAELEKFMDQKLKNYSSGMQVRLAFSVATRAKADILLIDEVLAVGDADFQRKCFNYFKKLKGSETTIIFVSHDMDAVREYCDRAVLVNNGNIVKSGNVDKVANSYTELFMHKNGEKAPATGKGKIFKNVAVATTEDYISLTGNMSFEEDTEGYIVGFSIKDSTGASLLGINSKLIKYKTPKLRKGESTSFSWQFPNILADGEYLVTIGIQDEDGVTPLEWLEDVVRFTLKRSVIVPYPILPEIRLDIGNNEDD